MTEGGKEVNPFAEFPLHGHSIACLSLSCDLRFLFSACEGGDADACSKQPHYLGLVFGVLFFCSPSRGQEMGETF